MFIQLIFAKAGNVPGARGHLERWQESLAPGAAGWLGSTAGVTADGRFVLAARFESESAARANSDRPEQGAWWQEVEADLDGPAEFLETTDVVVAHEGDPGSAGFVQLMRATVADRQRFEEVEERISPAFLELRPDVLGAYRSWFGDDRVVAIDYFRSEAEARAGESKEMPQDLQDGFGEWMAQLSDHQWYDITDPWLYAP